MALLFMDGFDAGDLAVKWNFLQGNATTSTTTRFGTGQSLSISNYFWGAYKTIPATSDLYVGFALYTASGGWAGNYETYISFNTNAGTASQVRLKLVAPTTLAIVRRDGTTLATSAAEVIQLNAWQYVEIYVKIADSGGRATVKVDGVEVIDYTGDTKHNGTLDDIDLVCFGEIYPGANYGPRVTTLIDDVYICDNTGPAPYNNFLGDVRVQTLAPNGAGSSTQFTPSTGANYETVDEIPYSATDYVESNTPGHLDLYTVSDIPTSNVVFAVNNNVIAKKTDAGLAQLRSVIKSGSATATGSTVVLSTTDMALNDLRVTDPDTLSGWTPSGVNAIESGMEVV